MRKALVILVLVDLALVGFTLLRFPNAGVGHAAPVLGILILIGAASTFIRFQPDALSMGIKIGILAGVILGGEVILEYIFLPQNNSVYGAVEYGLFLIALVASGVLIHAKHRLLKESGFAGLLAGIVGSLIWYASVLLVFHLFWGTAQQTQVFQAEGNFADFAQSGMKDFSAFIIQDFFGAGFFHLILGGIVGFMMGWIGGLGRSLIHTRAADIEA